MSKIIVDILDKRIQSAYQNAIEGRPSATTVVLETSSMRDAIERALVEQENAHDYEAVSVYDEKQSMFMDINKLAIAMNKFVLFTDYMNGKRVESGSIRYEALGRIETASERKQLWDREKHLEFNEYTVSK